MSAVQKTRNDATKKVAKSKPSAPSAEDVLELEEAIVGSPQNYNKIVTLLEYVQVCPSGPRLPTVLIYRLNYRTRPKAPSLQ